MDNLRLKLWDRTRSCLTKINSFHVVLGVFFFPIFCIFLLCTHGHTVSFFNLVLFTNSYDRFWWFLHLYLYPSSIFSSIPSSSPLLHSKLFLWVVSYWNVNLKKQHSCIWHKLLPCDSYTLEHSGRVASGFGACFRFVHYNGHFSSQCTDCGCGKSHCSLLFLYQSLQHSRRYNYLFLARIIKQVPLRYLLGFEQWTVILSQHADFVLLKIFILFLPV